MAVFKETISLIYLQNIYEQDNSRTNRFFIFL